MSKPGMSMPCTPHKAHLSCVCPHHACPCHQGYVMHAHVMHDHAMHSHVMPAHAVNCMPYARINSSMPTVAIEPKPVSQRHANSIVWSSVLQRKLACHYKLTASCQLPLKVDINHWHDAEQVISDMPVLQKNANFFLLYIAGQFYLIRGWHLNQKLKTLPTHP